MDSLLTYAQETGSQSSGFGAIWFVIGAVGLWKMFEMAGEPGWIGIIPFYRVYKLCEKVMGDPWYWLRELLVIIPFVGIFIAYYYKYQIGKAVARAYGKEDTWALGYTFLDAIFYAITGFGNSSYYGVYGKGDRRSNDARKARTVDFDVVKNEPEPEGKDSDVEFEFNQSDYTE